MPRGRRKKACDLCFTKKIKCDAREPRCSNCVLYKADCRQTIIRHRASVSHSKLTGIRGRNISPNNHLMGSTRHDSPLLTLDDAERTPNPAPLATGANVGIEMVHCGRNESWKFHPVQPVLYYGPRDDELRLPLLDDFMPIIDHYFSAVNTSIPLFDQTTFMKIVTRWSTPPSNQDTTSWAAILVIIALGLQSLDTRHPLRHGPFAERFWIDYALKNAQALIPELMTREDDLLGLQVIVALTLSFRHARDMRPAGILLSMAVRTAHRMQLQSTESTKYFTVDDVRQRSNVFWVIYMLDKDLSLRLKIPPLMLDNNIDIPFPSDTAEEDGSIPTDIEAISFNVFHNRVKLARLQGEIYDQLYSPHSIKVSVNERRSRVATLTQKLDQWYENIPATFRPDLALETLGQTELVQLAELYHVYLLCAVCVHGVWSRHAKWMEKLNSLSKAAVGDIAEAVQGPKVKACIETQLPPLSDGWEQCVTASRWCMRFLHRIGPIESLVWHNLCPHLSGTIVLLANGLIKPVEVLYSEDVRLANVSMEIYTDLVQVTGNTFINSLRQIIKDLATKTATAIIDTQRGQSAEIDLDLLGEQVDVFTGNSLEGPSPFVTHGDLMASFYGESTFDIDDTLI